MDTVINLYIVLVAWIASSFAFVFIWGYCAKRNQRRRFERMNQIAAERLKKTLPHDFAERPRGIGSNRTQ